MNSTRLTVNYVKLSFLVFESLMIDIIKYKNIVFEIWDFLKSTFKNYVIIESYKEQKKTLYIVNMEIKQLFKLVI